MASENRSLVQEFEESLQKCLSPLTEEDDLPSRDPEDGGRDMEDKMCQFTEVAKKLETYFLQKRLALHQHKPEMILREESLEMRQELQRKDVLIRNHHEKLDKWKEQLAAAQDSPRTPRPPVLGAPAPQMPGQGNILMKRRFGEKSPPPFIKFKNM